MQIEGGRLGVPRIAAEAEDDGSLGGTVSFTQMAAVPEPGTWLMMLVGFGAMGYSMRRQRRSTSLLTQAA